MIRQNRIILYHWYRILLTMKVIYSIITVTALLLISSCSNSLRYLTADMYRQNRWSATELNRIQFYVSEDIVLTRSDRKQRRSNIEDGKIRIKSEGKVEQIIIKKGTPGTFVKSPQSGKMAISFDSDGRFLMFGTTSKMDGRYVLLAKEWNRHWGIVTYGGVEYETTSSSALAALMVDIKKANKTSRSVERAGGSRVN